MKLSFYNITFETIKFNIICQIDIKSPPPVLPLIELLCEIVVDPFKPVHNQQFTFIIIVEKQMRWMITPYKPVSIPWIPTTLACLRGLWHESYFVKQRFQRRRSLELLPGCRLHRDFSLHLGLMKIRLDWMYSDVCLWTLGWRRASRIAVSLGVVQSITHLHHHGLRHSNHHRHHHGLQHCDHRLVADLASLSANLDLSLSSRLLSLWILASSLSNQAKVPTWIGC